MPEHPLDIDRYCGEAQLLERQVGNIGAGEELAHVELAARGAQLTIDVIIVHCDLELDTVRLDAAIDERLRAIIRTAGHAELERHCRPTALYQRGYSSASLEIATRLLSAIGATNAPRIKRRTPTTSTSGESRCSFCRAVTTSPCASAANASSADTFCNRGSAKSWKTRVAFSRSSAVRACQTA